MEWKGIGPLGELRGGCAKRYFGPSTLLVANTAFYLKGTLGTRIRFDPRWEERPSEPPASRGIRELLDERSEPNGFRRRAIRCGKVRWLRPRRCQERCPDAPSSEAAERVSWARKMYSDHRIFSRS